MSSLFNFLMRSLVYGSFVGAMVISVDSCEIFPPDESLKKGAQSLHVNFFDQVNFIYQRKEDLEKTTTFKTLVTLELIFSSLQTYKSEDIWGAGFRIGSILGRYTSLSTSLSLIIENFLPKCTHSLCRNVMKLGATAFMGYGIYQNSIASASDSLFGLMGVYMVQNILNFYQLDKSVEVEIEAFSLYGFRKLGWYTGSQFKEGIGTFLSFLPKQIINVVGFQPFYLVAGSLTLDETCGGISDTSLNCKDLPINTVACDIFEPHLHSEFPGMIEELRAILHSNSTKPNAIIIAENHERVTSLLPELILLKSVNEFGIKNLFVELTSTQLKYLSENFSKLDQNQNLIIKYKQALASGLKIYPMDDESRSMRDFLNPRRDEAMCEALRHSNESFIAIMGALHLNPLINYCKELNNKFNIVYMEFFRYSEDQFEKMTHLLPKDVTRIQKTQADQKDLPTLKFFLKGIISDYHFDTMLTSVERMFLSKRIGLDEVFVDSNENTYPLEEFLEILVENQD